MVPSLLAQDPPAAEVIVVDGGSTDGTWEWLEEAQARDSRLNAIRDETCSLKFSKGPVSRGRNVAIAAATIRDHRLRRRGLHLPARLAAQPDGSARRRERRIRTGRVVSRCRRRIALGRGLRAILQHQALAPDAPTKSCTARSMAFTRALWERVGRFPESVLVGEDTLFDAEARRQTQPAFMPQCQGPLPPAEHLPQRMPADDALRHQRRPVAHPQHPPVPQRAFAVCWNCSRSQACAGRGFRCWWLWRWRPGTRITATAGNCCASARAPMQRGLPFLLLSRGWWP